MRKDDAGGRSRCWNILGMEFSSFHSCDPSGFYAFEGGLNTYAHLPAVAEVGGQGAACQG